MALLRDLYSELRIALRMGQRLYDREMLVRRDIRRQLAAMGDDVPDAITRHENLRDWAGGAIALVILYRPDGGVPSDIVGLCKALGAEGVHVCLIANHPLSDEQNTAFAPIAGEIVERENQGGDFGAWREMTLELAERPVRPDRVIYLNDSVFYASRGLKAMIDQLCNGSSATFAFENWAIVHHLQSFAFALSGDLFSHADVLNFWSGYRPINNRIHAITMGEERLSNAIRSATDDIEVVYSVEKLARVLEAEDGFDADIITVPKMWRRRADHVMARSDASSFARARAVSRVTNESTPIHAGAYFFPRYLDCPLFKKDLVIRERFEFWEIEHWTRGLLPEDERDAYLAELRRRGEPGALPPMQRRRIAVGL